MNFVGISEDLLRNGVNGVYYEGIMDNTYFILFNGNKDL